MNEKILRDWNNADQYLKDNLNGIVSEVEHIKGTAEGQFIYDTEAKMTKVVPENVSKGIVAMIGGKTVKHSNIWDEQWINGNYTDSGGTTASTIHIRNYNPIPVKPNTAYTMVTTSNTYRIVFWTKDMNLVSSTGGLTDRVFVVPENAYFIGFNMDSVYGGAYKNDIAIYEGEIKNAVYGMGWLDNAPVDKITINNKVIPIPSAILNLPDYGLSTGDVYNYVDFEEMVYHHKVKEIGFNDLTWTLKNATSSVTSNYFQSSDISDAKTVFINSICSKYYHGADRTYLNDNDKTYSKYNDGTLYLIVRDDSYSSNSSESEFVKANADTKFVYELAEEELVPLTDLLLPFKCESGGTIAFENERNLDVPNTVIYEKEMK